MGNKYRETALEIIKKYAQSELPEMVTIDTSIIVSLVGLLLDTASAIKQAEDNGKREATGIDAMMENCFLTDEADLICKPQFDAEKVNELIAGLYRYAEAAIENRDDCGHLYWSSFTITIDQLRAALGITNG